MRGPGGRSPPARVEHEGFQGEDVLAGRAAQGPNPEPGAGHMNAPSGWKPREIEILRLLAEGLTNTEIGARLHLAGDTVRWYNKRLFEKLGVKNRLHAVSRASELGLLPNSTSAHTVEAQPAPRPIRSPVQYAANGAVHIAYQVIGQGPVDLLFIHGFLSHLELAWENPEFTSFFEQLGRAARVILFDKRGVGLSDRMQGAPTLEATMEDARRVLEAVGSERAFVMGTSEGAAAAVLLAATYPERVQGLILCAATAKVVQTNHEPAWADPEDQFARMIERMQQTWGGPWAVDSFAPSRAHDERFRAWWATILRAASSPSSVKAVLDLVREVDIRALLPQVRVRTLVIHKTDDRIVSVEAGRYLAAHLPRATWVELPGRDHIYFVESGAILSSVIEFCQAPEREAVDTWLGIIAYVERPATRSAEAKMMAALAAQPARRTLLTPAAIVALFQSPLRALRCALQLRGADHAAEVRISLHVGECRLADGQPDEAVLRLAGEAMECAAPGEILVTQTLHDILAGSDFRLTRQTGLPAGDALQGMALFRLE